MFKPEEDGFSYFVNSKYLPVVHLPVKKLPTLKEAGGFDIDDLIEIDDYFGEGSEVDKNLTNLDRIEGIKEIKPAYKYVPSDIKINSSHKEDCSVKELRLTVFNTIVGDDFEEISANDFIDTIENEYGNSYAIYYEKNHNRLKVIYDSKEYYLILDENVMKDYITGKHTPFTLRIKQIIDKVASEKGKKQQKEIIIKEAENGIMPNEDEARRIYLEYLLENKKIINRIKKYLSNFHMDFMDSSKFLNIRHDTVKNRYLIATLNLFLLIWWFVVLVFSEVFSFKFMYPILWRKNFTSAIRFLFNLGKKRFNRLINYGNNRKMIDYKIKQLKIALENNKLKLESNSEKLECPSEEKNASLEDPIMIEINKVIEELASINHVDRQALSKKIEEILKEYRERFNRIQEQDDDVLTLGEDNLFALRMDIIHKINSVEMRINEIKDKDFEMGKMSSEYKTLINKLEQMNKKTKPNYGYKFTPGNEETKEWIAMLKKEDNYCKKRRFKNSKRTITGYYNYNN